MAKGWSFERENGRWTARYRVGKDSVTVGTYDTEVEADEAWERAISLLENGVDPTDHKMTFRQYCEQRWLPSIRGELLTATGSPAYARKALTWTNGAAGVATASAVFDVASGVTVLNDSTASVADSTRTDAEIRPRDRPMFLASEAKVNSFRGGTQNSPGPDGVRGWLFGESQTVRDSVPGHLVAGLSGSRAGFLEIFNA